MKTQSFLFLCLCFNQFICIKSRCTFKYQNGEGEDWPEDCFCGSKKEPFSFDYGDKYCCVHQNSTKDCQIDVLTNGKWCPNATLLSNTQICNNNCYYDSYQDVCPSNPEACMNFQYGCDGRERCEAFCTGPLENFPYYDQAAKNCVDNSDTFRDEFPYCGKRDKAKYDNHQCFKSQSDSVGNIIGFQCLNRKDISENTIRRSGNYDKFVSSRKNLFQYFKANDTRNQVNGTHIICDNQTIDMNCIFGGRWSVVECKKEETDNGGVPVSSFDVCDALDFLEYKGLPPPSDNYLTSRIYASPQKLGMLCNKYALYVNLGIRSSCKMLLVIAF